MSGVILAPVIYLIPHNAILCAVIANFIGGCVFFWVDKFIFTFKIKKQNEYN